ncbi:coiled coil protein [Fluoribacter gormanii]|uniref:coiled coil protein n=1 Tax=Fluoribacter gormanii TaxID=464 RepID=UPI0022430964|nr:coiled coil protein [Fluoribacter gormanii]MCW8444863.1 coiled coil protein [Fluoribacter gormanii]
MYILKHLLAILLGITVLPLRILAYNMVYATIALLLGVATVIGLPIAMASSFKDSGMSAMTNFLLTMMVVVPMTLAITTIALTITATYLIYNTVINMLESFWLGFKNGLLYEMDGFWSAYNSQTLFDVDLVSLFRAYVAGVNTEELIDDVDFDGFQRIRGELEDVVVVHEDLEVPDLEHKDSKKPSLLLDHTQLQRIDKLIKELAELKDPLPHQAKQHLESLKTLYMQYNDLSKKLDEVRTALVKNDKTQIKDEIIAYNDVETPILLVKQYKNEKDGKWYNVPANSYVTDKDSLLHWLKQNPRHPLNKDLLKNPDPYNGMTTRYTWYVLTIEECSSQELDEAAAQMSVLADTLLSILPQKIELGLGASPQSFFGLGMNPSVSSPSNLAHTLTDPSCGENNVGSHSA